MVKHLMSLIKAIVATIVLFLVLDALYIGYLHYLGEWKGTLGYDIEQLAITADKKPIGFIWGEIKTYGLLGFIFVVVWVREYF